LLLDRPGPAEDEADASLDGGVGRFEDDECGFINLR
jgi:hypothetical protein